MYAWLAHTGCFKDGLAAQHTGCSLQEMGDEGAVRLRAHLCAYVGDMLDTAKLHGGSVDHINTCAATGQGAHC